MRWPVFFLLVAAVTAVRGQDAATNAAPVGTGAPADEGAEAPAGPAVPIDPAKEAEVRKMIENSGIKNTMKAAMIRMLDSYKTKYPAVPPEFWTQVVSDASLDDFVGRLVPIYSQCYSLEDLKAINAFYESPAGRHMVQAEPQIAGASKLAGRQWGREMGAKIMSGVLAQQAKVYAAEDKSIYYTSTTTNNPPATPAGASPAAASAPSAPAAGASAAPVAH